MARISSYPIDLVVTAKDKWIGTDAAGSITKNFSAEKVAEFLNNTGAIDSTWTRYKFKNQASLSSGTFALSPDSGATPLFSGVQNIQIHQKDASDKNVSELYGALVGSQVLLQSADDPSKFGVFKWQTSEITSPGSEFYTISLTFVGGNGTLQVDSDYLLSLLLYDVSSLGDKHHEHLQDQASETWTIQHNLGKFPAVHIVLSTGDYGFGEVTYNDKNNITISLGYAVAGRAFLN